MKKIAIILLLIAYLPLFFYRGGGTFGIVLHDIYAICTALGVALILWGDVKRGENELVPLASLFTAIGVIFILNTLFDKLYETYYPLFITILSCILFYVLIVFLWHRYKRQT